MKRIFFALVSLWMIFAVFTAWGEENVSSAVIAALQKSQASIDKNLQKLSGSLPMS